MKFSFPALLIFLVCGFPRLAAQVKQPLERKLSPGLKKEITQSPRGYEKLIIHSRNYNELKKLLQQKGLEKNILEERPEYRTMVVELPFQQLYSQDSISTLIEFADIYRKPKEETIIDGFDRTANQLNKIYSELPEINGTGIHISIKEQRPDSLDMDFSGRYKPSEISPPRITTHATKMATIAAGAGNSSEESRGAAWGSFISASDFENLLPDPVLIFRNQEILVQNHSYGTGVENYYGADAAAYDSLSWMIPGLLHIFSAGNSGMETPASGAYAGIAQSANLTGSFKMAKNIITVGATDSIYRVPLSSSKGPAYDGRLKPELVAYGEDGSSGAAAVVSGIAAVLQHQYARFFNGQKAPSFLVKAILLNTARDLGPSGIDFSSGFGMAQAFDAVTAMNPESFFLGESAPSQTDSLKISVAGAAAINILLCWNDLPSIANADKALVNDLDLYVRDPQGKIHYPWILNPFPHPDSLQQPASRGQDTLNPVEQVSIDLPTDGEYTIFIKARSLSATQPYAVSYVTKPPDYFEWNYPAKNDKLKAGSENLLRWSSNLAGPATVEFSLDKGNTWQNALNVNLETGYARWTAPDTFAAGLLRISMTGKEIVSDRFSISRQSDLEVGYLCDNSILFLWDNPTTDSFRLYMLGEKYLEPLQVSKDSVFQSSLPLSSKFFAIAPVIDSIEGRRSYMIDYTMQGAGCYINSFLAELVEKQGRIRFTLGTARGIEGVILEKFINGNWTEIKQWNDISSLSFEFIDSSLFRGNNQYRLKLSMSNQPGIVSGIESFFYFADDAVVVYPNPARIGTSLKVASSDPEGLVFEVYDSMGRKVMERKLFELVEQLSGTLKAGIYFYRITRDIQMVSGGKIIIQ